MTRCSFVTFYSFKGGVGRTRTLANVAYELVRKGFDVLCIDFDLEAPDLTRYFAKWMTHSTSSEPESASMLPGLLDLVEAFQRFMVTRDPSVTCPDAQPYCHDLHGYDARMRKPEGVSKVGRLSVLPAGSQDADYPRRLAALDWAHFYEKLDGGLFIERVRAELSRLYDFVLIDSRTGFADVAGICTIQLPDVLVPVFSTSRTSVCSVEMVVDAALRRRIEQPRDTPLRIVPVPARVDREYVRPDEIKAWLDWLSQQKIAQWMTSADPSVRVEEAFDGLMIRYKPRYAYSADLECAVEDETGVTEDNPACYRRLAEIILSASDAPSVATAPEDKRQAFTFSLPDLEASLLQPMTLDRQFIEDLEPVSSADVTFAPDTSKVQLFPQRALEIVEDTRTPEEYVAIRPDFHRVR